MCSSKQSAAIRHKIIHSKLLKVLLIVTETLFKEIKPNEGRPEQSIMKGQDKEIWWYSRISTTRRVQHNRPDLVAWTYQGKQCFIIDIGVPLDRNIKVKEKEKFDAYMRLLTNVKVITPSVPISNITSDHRSNGGDS